MKYIYELLAFLLTFASEVKYQNAYFRENSGKNS